jgi:hypothetical protein
MITKDILKFMIIKTFDHTIEKCKKMPVHMCACVYVFLLYDNIFLKYEETRNTCMHMQLFLQCVYFLLQKY